VEERVGAQRRRRGDGTKGFEHGFFKSGCCFGKFMWGCFCYWLVFYSAGITVGVFLERLVLSFSKFSLVIYFRNFLFLSCRWVSSVRILF
jgi:hypothetical protein